MQMEKVLAITIRKLFVQFVFLRLLCKNIDEIKFVQIKVIIENCVQFNQNYEINAICCTYFHCFAIISKITLSLKS